VSDLCCSISCLRVSNLSGIVGRGRAHSRKAASCVAALGSITLIE
jgi:hypothetical protein